jgi:hypothetical protein
MSWNGKGTKCGGIKLLNGIPTPALYIDLQRPIKYKEAVKNVNIRTNSKDHIDV